MKAKKEKQDELRMKASEFDRMMRRALGTPPLASCNKPKKSTKSAKKKIRRK